MLDKEPYLHQVAAGPRTVLRTFAKHRRQTAKLRRWWRLTLRRKHNNNAKNIATKNKFRLPWKF